MSRDMHWPALIGLLKRVAGKFGAKRAEEKGQAKIDFCLLCALFLNPVPQVMFQTSRTFIVA